MALLIDTSVLVDAERRGPSLNQGLDARAAFVEGVLAGLEPLPVKVIGAHDMWIAATAVSHGLLTVIAA